MSGGCPGRVISSLLPITLTVGTNSVLRYEEIKMCVGPPSRSRRENDPEG